MEMGIHRMLQDRWGLTMACRSQVPWGFGLRHPSRHQALQPLPKPTARYEHPGLRAGQSESRASPMAGSLPVGSSKDRCWQRPSSFGIYSDHL